MTLLGLLGAVGAVVGWALLGALLLAVIGLAVPFDGFYDSGRPPARLRVTWLWGALGLYPRKRGGQREKKGKDRKKQKEKKSRGDKAANPARRRGLIDLARDPEFRHRAIDDLLRLLRRLELPLVDLRIILGLGDPADTGLVYGLLSAAVAGVDHDAGIGITRDERHRVQVEPLFDEAILDLHGRAHLRLVPIAVLGTALQIALGYTGRRVIRVVWRTRKR